jgi:hypothetical protein
MPHAMLHAKLAGKHRTGSPTAWLLVRRFGPLLVVWDGCRGRPRVSELRVNGPENSRSRSGQVGEPLPVRAGISLGVTSGSSSSACRLYRLSARHE